MCVCGQLTQHMVRSYQARGGRGDIINIGSIAGRDPYAGGAIYCATKAAVRAFTESLRKELISTRIRVMEVDPGQVETEFSVVRFGGDREKADAVYASVAPSPSRAWWAGTDVHMGGQRVRAADGRGHRRGHCVCGWPPGERRCRRYACLSQPSGQRNSLASARGIAVLSSTCIYSGPIRANQSSSCRTTPIYSAGRVCCAARVRDGKQV